MPTRPNYPVTPESIARAKAARDAERAELLRFLLARGERDIAERLGLIEPARHDESCPAFRLEVDDRRCTCGIMGDPK